VDEKKGGSKAPFHYSENSLLAEFALELLDQLGHNFLIIADDTEGCCLENRCVRIFIDSYDTI
jgi:hypothetical protein